MLLHGFIAGVTFFVIRTFAAGDAPVGRVSQARQAAEKLSFLELIGLKKLPKISKM
jgi:hypothetical protein